MLLESPPLGFSQTGLALDERVSYCVDPSIQSFGFPSEPSAACPGISIAIVYLSEADRPPSEPSVNPPCPLGPCGSSSVASRCQSASAPSSEASDTNFSEVAIKFIKYLSRDPARLRLNPQTDTRPRMHWRPRRLGGGV